MSAKKPEREPRNEKLKIELPFEEAVKAALEAKPPSRGKETKKRGDPRERPPP